MSSIRSIVRSLSLVPGPRHLRQLIFDRQFAVNREGQLFRGVFPTYADAVAACPTHGNVGYDNEDSAALYKNYTSPDDYDYPTMFWLQRALDQGLRTVFDLGGHTGIKFYAFSKLFAWPEDLRWTVGDVPAVVQQGRRIAAARGASQLSFADHATAFDGTDVLLASGSLQYLPNTLAQMLATTTHKPRRVIVNTTPIHPDRAYFTINSIGTAYCAYRVQRGDEFVRDIAALGYTLLDTWKNPGKRLDLPFNEGHTLTYYTGFCFERS